MLARGSSVPDEPEETATPVERTDAFQVLGTGLPVVS
jgi:hypothetical protein